MALESFTRAFWPLGSALAVLWAALAFGLAEVTTRDAAARRRSALAGARRCSRCSCSGVRRFRWPSAAAARARIDATLPGRPLATLRDTPALGRDDPGAQAVWAAHLARMRRLAATARPVRGRPAAREPRPLGAAADGAGAADRRAASSRATAGSSRSPRRCSRRRARRSRPGRASRAGPSRRPIPGGRRSICPRCRATRRCRCREGTRGDAARLRRAGAVRAGRDGVGRRRRALAEAAPGIAAAEFPVGGQRLGDAAAGRRRRSAPGASPWSRTSRPRSR